MFGVGDTAWNIFIICGIIGFFGSIAGLIWFVFWLFSHVRFV